METRHIERICDMRATLQAQLDILQCAIESNNNKNFVFKDASGNYHIVANLGESASFSTLYSTGLTENGILVAGSSGLIKTMPEMVWDNSNKAFAMELGTPYGGIWISMYNATAVSGAPWIHLRKSHTATLGTLVTTIDTEQLGEFVVSGVNTSNTFISAMRFQVTQSGNAGASYVPIRVGIIVSTDSGNSTERFSLEANGESRLGKYNQLCYCAVSTDSSGNVTIKAYDGCNDRNIILGNGGGAFVPQVIIQGSVAASGATMTVCRNGTIAMVEASADPATPTAGYGYLYTKSDNKLYFVDGDGVAHNFVETAGTIVYQNDVFASGQIKAKDANGISITDKDSVLGIFVKDGGSIGFGTNDPKGFKHDLKDLGTYSDLGRRSSVGITGADFTRFAAKAPISVSDAGTLIDDGSLYVVRESGTHYSSGFGWVSMGASSVSEQIAVFRFQNNVVTLISNSANVSTSDTDGNLCIIASTGNIRIKNTLGASVNFNYSIQYGQTYI